MTTLAEEYRELIELGWSEEDAASQIDATVMTFEEWREAHGYREQGREPNKA